MTQPAKAMARSVVKIFITSVMAVIISGYCSLNQAAS
jgi:hypothetical protein